MNAAHGIGNSDSRARMRSHERGFSLIEILIVLIMIAILMATVAPSFRNSRDAASGAVVATGGGKIWRAVQQYRLDNQGVMPTAAMLTARSTNGYGGGLKDAAGVAYVPQWPDGADAKYLPIVGGSGAAPRAGDRGSRRNTLVYSTNGTTGWIAGYNGKGTVIFVRGIGAGGTPVVAAG